MAAHACWLSCSLELLVSTSKNIHISYHIIISYPGIFRYMKTYDTSWERILPKDTATLKCWGVQGGIVWINRCQEWSAILFFLTDESMLSAGRLLRRWLNWQYSWAPGRILHQDRSPYDQAAGGLQLGAENKVLDKYYKSISGIIIPCSDGDLYDESNGFFEEREVLLLAHRWPLVAEPRWCGWCRRTLQILGCEWLWWGWCLLWWLLRWWRCSW